MVNTILTDGFNERVDNWEPIELEAFKNEANDTDFADFTDRLPVVSERAKAVLEPILKDKVQFLPVIYKDKYYFMNVLNVVYCLDVNRSNYKVNKNNQRYLLREAYFIEEKIKPEEIIFKVGEIGTNYRDIYITEHFIKIVKEAKLTGFKAQEVWDSSFTVEVEEATKKRIADKVYLINGHIEDKYDWAGIQPVLQAGQAVASGVYKLQYNRDGELMQGILQGDLTYAWYKPIYISPGLLELKWGLATPEDI